MINALKSLMQIPDWPTNLVVSGTPELHDLLTQDPQLSRRFFITRFLPVTEFDACDDVAELVARYAGLADLPLAPDLADVEFVPRLLHAGREQFGIVVELIIGAITRAWRTDIWRWASGISHGSIPNAPGMSRGGTHSSCRISGA